VGGLSVSPHYYNLYELVNDNPTEERSLDRGLRQRGFSFFLLAFEGMNFLICASSYVSAGYLIYW